MFEHQFELETNDGKPVVVVFQNRLMEMIRHRVWFESFGKDKPDEDLRLRFCWFAAHVKSIDGVAWKPPAETCTEKQFEQSYRAFAELVDYDTLKVLSAEVDAMKARKNPLEKPDDQLTGQEQADPN